MKNLKFIFNNSAYDSKSLTFISQFFELCLGEGGLPPLRQQKL